MKEIAAVVLLMCSGESYSYRDGKTTGSSPVSGISIAFDFDKRKADAFGATLPADRIAANEAVFGVWGSKASVVVTLDRMSGGVRARFQSADGSVDAYHLKCEPAKAKF